MSPAGAPTRSQRLWTFFWYVVMVAVAAAIFLLIRAQGEGLRPAASMPAAARATALPSINILFHVLLAMAVIIAVARLAGAAFSRIGQPAVVGEVVGGILLGPSLLGRIAPDLSSAVFPANIAPHLAVLANLGVILFMFLVGVQVDLRVIARSGHATLAVSHASIIVPFLLGSALALGIYPILASGVSFTVFALFLGAAMSVTAFPVLARILTDRGMQRTRMGSLALTCAAIDDATAWCLLTLIVSLAEARPGRVLVTVGLTIAYVVIVLVAGSRLVRSALPFFEREGGGDRSTLTIIFVAILLSAVATEYIGIHAIFGAFLCGAIIPSNSRLAAELRNRLEDIVSVLLLPTFFAFTGLRTEIGLVSGLTNWILCGVIIAVACLGKFGGTLVAARLTGLGWRDSASLGVLMNTRGLVELIVLNVGLDLGLVTPTLFAMMVVMALVTTFMTTPILHLIVHRHPWPELGTAADVPAREGVGLPGS